MTRRGGKLARARDDTRLYARTHTYIYRCNARARKMKWKEVGLVLTGRWIARGCPVANPTALHRPEVGANELIVREIRTCLPDRDYARGFAKPHERLNARASERACAYQSYKSLQIDFPVLKPLVHLASCDSYYVLVKRSR